MSSTSLLFCWVGVVSSLIAAPAAIAQDQSAPPTLKSVLLEQLRATHDREEWFVPVKIAIEGLTPEQAAWKDESDNHSIVQLVNHLIFWNQQQLAKFKGEKPAAFSGDNKETFADLNKATWEASVKQLDEVLSAGEKAIEEADEAKLTKWYSTIARISTHNAYHTGQIIYIRKMKGNWNPEKGVK
ncbi:MAG: DinB family protein [Chthoniobacterales bacterium]